MDHRAFSLIEVMLVVLILGIVAAAVSLNLTGPMHRARASDLAEEIASFDRLTRTYARRHDRPLRLVIDLSEGRIRRMDGSGTETIGAPLELGSSWRIARLLVGNQDVDFGTVSITCSRRGLTPTYAMLLEDRRGPRRWILIAGLTGQPSEMSDEKEIRQTLAAIASRHHAG
jgi:prepilin-type N-terminal cleavage/methylation domain-containing protein